MLVQGKLMNTATLAQTPKDMLTCLKRRSS